MRPPRELSVPHSARALFPPTPHRRTGPLTSNGSSSRDNVDMEHSADAPPMDSASRANRFFSGDGTGGRPRNLSHSEESEDFFDNKKIPSTANPAAPKKKGAGALRAPRKPRGGTGALARDSFGFAAPSMSMSSRSPRYARKPLARALPDTPVMMSPAYGDDSQDVPGMLPMCESIWFCVSYRASRTEFRQQHTSSVPRKSLC